MEKETKEGERGARNKGGRLSKRWKMMGKEMEEKEMIKGERKRHEEVNTRVRKPRRQRKNRGRRKDIGSKEVLKK